eukprot:2054533-Prymnesium_polylepis.1
MPSAKLKPLNAESGPADTYASGTVERLRACSFPCCGSTVVTISVPRWRLTPVVHASGGRTRPWISVVEDNPFLVTLYVAPAGRGNTSLMY